MEEYAHLRVYQASCELVEVGFALTQRFPRYHEKLKKQLDDAADSIGSNIAEGCGRKNNNHGNTELIRYLHMSFASANETQHRIRTALIRQFVTQKQYWSVYNRVHVIKKMLRAWVAKLEKDDRGRA